MHSKSETEMRCQREYSPEPVGHWPCESGSVGSESKLAMPGASTDASVPVACVVQHLNTLCDSW